MCGRYVSVQSVLSVTDLQILFDSAETAGDELAPSWNVAPTDAVYAVVERRAKDARQVERQVERQIRTLRWGLVPSWAKDPSIGSRLINARVETLAEKPAWRKAFATRRAVLPAAGYYEWQAVEQNGKTRKQPYFIHRADGGVLPFAGLYELWRDPAKDADDPTRWLWTAAVITVEAQGPLGEIHDRTPLILPDDRIDAWLDPELTDPERAADLLAGLPVADLQARPVPMLVNRVDNDGPELIDTLAGVAEQPLQLALTF